MKEAEQVNNVQSIDLTETCHNNNGFNISVANSKINRQLSHSEQEHINEIEKLIATNKKLLTIIAHDIKSPMGTIISFLTLLKERIPELDKNEIERHVNMALLSAKKTIFLFDDLLHWAFAENAIKLFHQEEVHLNDLIVKELDNIKLAAYTKHINITFEINENELVEIDVNMIRTVLRNLLSNAVKFTDQHGEIIINTKKENGFIEISIKDNGVGMNKEMQELIFSGNSYNSTLGTANEIGNGFGLLLCKEFIDAHGGKIWIISNPFKGSEFKFTLPVKNRIQ